MELMLMAIDYVHRDVHGIYRPIRCDRTQFGIIDGRASVRAASITEQMAFAPDRI
jgi:hypothetical protein